MQLYYSFLTFLNKCSFKCLHLVISFDFLFNIFLSLIKLIIHSFYVIHNLHKSGCKLPCTLAIIVHLTEKLMLWRFSCQIYFANSVLFSYFSCLKYLMWFLYLSSKVVSANPKENFSPSFASLITSALYITD